MLDLASGGVWRAIFIVNLITRLAEKLHRIILLDLGLVTFRIHFGKTQQVINFMFFGPSGHDHDSPNQLFLIWETPRYFESPRKNHQTKHIFGHLRMSEIGTLKIFEKTGPKHPEVPLDKFLKIWDLGSIPSRKH